MKTIKQWISELPEPYRSQALKNTTKKIQIVPVKDIKDALVSAFIWSYSKQGHDY